MIRKQKSIKKNIVMNVILNVSNFIFPLITYSYVARVILPIGTGKVAFANSVLSYFLSIASLGIPAYGRRECAKIRDDKKRLSHLVQELLIINIGTTLVAYILLCGMVIFVPKLYSYKELFVIMSSNILLTTLGMEWLYQAIEEYTYITVRSLFFKSISIILTLVLIRTEEDYIWYGFLSVFTTSASYILNLWNVRKYISFKKMETYSLKKHIKPILTMFSASVIISIYSNLDISMLGIICNEEEVGLYSAALKIKNLLASVSISMTTVLIPRISYYIECKLKRKVRELLLISLRLLLIITIPIAIYIFIFSTNVLHFLVGEEYVQAADSLRILIICIIPMVLTNLYGNLILIPYNQEKRYSQSVFIGMWINIILNTMLIPVLGAVGAAIGTLITECWNVFWMGKGVKGERKYILANIKWNAYIVSITSATICSCIIYCFIKDLNNMSILMVTAIVYFGVLYIIMLLMKEKLVIGIVKKIKQ